MTLAGNTAIIIGAAGGMGSEVARRMAAPGVNLALVDRRPPEDLASLAAEASKRGGRAIAIHADVTRAAEIDAMVDRVLREFQRIDILVNTQGRLNQLHWFLEETPDSMNSYIELELKSVMNICRAVGPTITQQGSGRVITIGSDSGKVGSLAEAVSAACRGGVIAFSKSLAREWARYNVNVNVVCPGPTETGLLQQVREAGGITTRALEGMLRTIPKRRPAAAREVADVVVFLASEESSYITGQAISVSGGLTMC